ncbi:lactococcin 972-like bacteriocin [Curtobacterium sp. AG1037]|uniref:lactococcin 972 family bacteriocin n=1 Tax=Curtobacterium sp. AG1037 TaxID=2183990 RepID=UPI000E2CE63F|nr:lactococcin 972 family bacteriocin [Curtobacterium sp. AG1037]RDH96853.1 lactococcin 972-like bacteriocin [Curtobacterium sp. AG1037]
MRKSMMTVAVLATAASLCALGVTSASADERPDVAGSVVGGSASADQPSTARNGTAYVGGGTWTYGVWDGRVHSLFNTARSTHRASVKSNGVLVRSDWVALTRTAYAHRPAAIAGNQAFWDIRG